MPEDNDAQEDESGLEICPECGAEDCEAHLLAAFDLSGDEGEFEVGLVGGALYDLDAIGKVLELARRTWVQRSRAKHGLSREKCSGFS
jgi:hypothetical protein